VSKVQGYENRALDILLKEYSEDEILTDRKDVPEIWYIGEDNKKHRYYTDIYIPKDNLIIEVKSTWTYSDKHDPAKLDKNVRKQIGSVIAGYNFKFMIL